MKGRKIELFIPGELKEEPVIYTIIRKFDVKVKIIEASFSAESGWAILVIDGDKNTLKKLVDFLTAKGIGIEFRD